MARHLLLGTALQTGMTFAAAVLSLPATAQPAANAHPTGGVVVAGSAAIGQTANTTTINQLTQRAAVNWQSFDVGSQQRVDFRQPSASAITLNRVVGPDPSRIAGRIDANGQVALVNQSGVTFFKGAQVNTNGLMVSAIGITNQNFMAGKMVFDQPGSPNARVENQGTITVREAGLAALVAPQVANSGVIKAKLGHIVLAGARTATLDLYGDGLLSLDVSNQVTQAPVGADGKPATALATNTGVIIADGGTVQLTARAADGVVQNLVNAGGRIRAATVGNSVGTVALGGVGGSIVVEGQLSTPGIAPGTKGGAIEVVSDGNVTVASTAKIDTSGTAGGGMAAIGTTLARARGGPTVTPTLVAASTVIRPGAHISANATARGDAGRVTVLSSKSTDMAGAITAEGGPQGGHGGFVEVSGNDAFSLTGAIDGSAPKGATGTILLDPRNLTVGKTGTDNDKLGVTAPQMTFNTVPHAESGDAFISAAVVSGLKGNIELQASQDLTVTAPITLTTAGQSLTLQAGADLTVALGGAITTKGDITLSAATPPPPKPSFPGFNAAGALTLNDSVSTSGGTLSLTAGSGGIILKANTAATAVALNSAGGVSQADGALTTTTLTGDVTGRVALTSSGNAVSKLGNFTSTLGFALMNDKPLVVTGTVSGGGFDVTVNNSASLGISGKISASQISLSGSSINIPGTINGTSGVPTNQVSLIATDGAITEAPTGSIIVPSVLLASTLGTGGDISLTSTANRITESSGMTATNGNVVVVNGQNLTLFGNYSGNNLFFEVAKIGGTLALTPATLTATAGGRITLVADNYSVPLSPRGPPSAIFAVGGTLELAPYGPSNATARTSNLLSSNILSIVNVETTELNTLVIGGFTDVPHGAVSSAPSAKNITIDGTLAFDLTDLAATLDLEATGSVTQSAPIINVGTLLGTTGSAALSTVANSVNTLGSFRASGGAFALDDGGVAGNLTVTGPVTGTTVTIKSAPTSDITVAGSIRATTQATLSSGAGAIKEVHGGTITGTIVELNGGGITVDGSIGATTQVTIASAGSITGTGVITTALLTGSAGTNVDLTGENAVTGLGNFTTKTGFTLDDVPALTVIAADMVNGGSNVTISDTGALHVAGTVTGTTIGLSGSGIDISGAVNGPTSVTLTSGGSITGEGVITTALLTGSAGTNVDLTGANAVTGLGNFTAKTGFTLDDVSGLTVITADTVDGGSNVTIVDTGALSVAGTMTGTTVALSGSGIGISGAVNGPTSVKLTSGSSITGEGVITTALLTGRAAANVDLTGANAVTGMGNFTATTGLNLDDTRALTVNNGATVAGGSNVTIADTGALSVVGTVIAAQNVSLGGSAIAATGSIGAGANLTVTAGSGGISLNNRALLTGAVVDLTTTGGGVSEASTATITGTLQSTGGVVGNVDLLGTANTIVAVNKFAVTGDRDHFTLDDSSGLTVAGAVTAPGQIYFETTNADGIAITTTGSVGAGTLASFQADTFSNLGNVTSATFELAPATKGNTLALTSFGNVPNNDRIGAVTPPGAAAPIITAGSIVIGVNFGTIATTLELDSLGGISETTGAITAASLSGQAGATVALGNANTITGLGSFPVAGGGNFLMNDTGETGNLTISGPVIAAGIAISDAGTITAAGGIDAGPGTLKLATTGGGGILLNNAAAILTGVTVDLDAAGGGITEAAAVINATTLLSSGGVTGNVALGGLNNVATLAGFAVTDGNFTLSDGASAKGLAVTGPVTAGNVAIVDASVITVTGSITVSDSVLKLASTGEGGIRLNTGAVLSGVTVDVDAAGGGIAETSGIINATTLMSSGGITGNVALTGLNHIATLGDFSVSSFTLNDSADLLIPGTLSAPHIAIVALSNTISLGDGATIITSGTVRPAGPIQSALEPINGAPGALLEAANFTQIGSSTVFGLNGAPATLQIATTGRDQFDPPLGLQGTGTWLILDLANGSAAGNVFVKALDVAFTAAGSANLTGTIGGIVGGAAAAAASIQPETNMNYLFNGCIIASAVCQPPTSNPLNPGQPPTSNSVNPGQPPTANSVNPGEAPASNSPNPGEAPPFDLLSLGLTSTFGGIYTLLAPSPAVLASPPKLLFLTWPMLSGRPPQLTDSDVLPPNITYLDY